MVLVSADAVDDRGHGSEVHACHLLEEDEHGAGPPEAQRLSERAG